MKQISSAAMIGSAGLALTGGIASQQRSRDRAKDIREAGRFNRRRVTQEGTRQAAKIAPAARGRGVTGRGLEDVIGASLGEIELAAMEEEFRANQAAAQVEDQGNLDLLSGVITGASLLAQPGALDLLRRRRPADLKGRGPIHITRPTQ